MNITFNGTPTTIPNGELIPLVAQLLGKDITPQGTAADGSALGIAVAVNHTVIPRGLWSAQELQDGDTVEIVTAVQGG